MYSIKVNAQINLNGKVTYQRINSNNTTTDETIEMWFNKSEYIQKNKPKDIRLTNNYKSTINNINASDSLKYEESIDATNIANNNSKTNLYYGSLENSIITYKGSLSETTFLCTNDTLKTFVNWELLQDTMTINKIFCQKAVGKFNDKEFIAWYAPSIPTSVAPYQLRGLPGLLIYVKSLNSNLTLTATQVEWPSKEKLENYKFTCTQLVTKQEFDKIKRNANDTNLQKIKSAKNITEILEILKN